MYTIRSLVLVAALAVGCAGAPGVDEMAEGGQGGEAALAEGGAAGSFEEQAGGAGGFVSPEPDATGGVAGSAAGASGSGGSSQGGQAGSVPVDPLAPYVDPACPSWDAFDVPLHGCLVVVGKFFASTAPDNWASTCTKPDADQSLKTCRTIVNNGQSKCSAPGGNYPVGCTDDGTITMLFEDAASTGYGWRRGTMGVQNGVVACLDASGFPLTCASVNR